jgi:hypothetical protein
LKVGKNVNLLWYIAYLVVREVHFGYGHAVPPILPIQRQLLKAKEFRGHFFGLLADIVEGAGLQGTLDSVSKRLLLNHDIFDLYADGIFIKLKI